MNQDQNMFLIGLGSKIYLKPKVWSLSLKIMDILNTADTNETLKPYL